MELKQRQYKVLVVSSKPKFNESLEGLLSQRKHLTYEFLDNASSAKRRLLDSEFDIIMINAPLTDDSGISLAIDFSANLSNTVLLIVPSEYYAEIFSKVRPHGIYVIPKPISAHLMRQAMDWLEVTCERSNSAEKKLEPLERRMAEIKLVNRAKLLLISVHGYSEEQAHHAIERSAMDRGVKKSVIAEEIIAMNDTDDQ